MSENPRFLEKLATWKDLAHRDKFAEGYFRPTIPTGLCNKILELTFLKKGSEDLCKAKKGPFSVLLPIICREAC